MDFAIDRWNAMRNEAQNGIAGSLLRKRRALFFSVLAVLLPLAILLILQYRWLVDLEEKSTIVWRSSLNRYLGGVAKDVYYFYKDDAYSSLAIQPSFLEPEKIHEASYFFARNEAKGAQRRFLVSTLLDPPWQIQVFDPETKSLRPPDESSETRAIAIALAPWKMVAFKGAPVDLSRLAVDQRDPRYRIILNPILGDGDRFLGLTGYVVDQAYFEREVLPKAVDKVLSDLGNETDLRITVQDGLKRTVLSRGGTPVDDVHSAKKQILRSFDFVFDDWRIILEGSGSKPRRLARTSFGYNITLSVLLSAALLGGILLLLRTTTREMKLIEMKNDFVSNVSHELRTPLASIRVFGELLRLGRVSSSDKAREYGEYIETESRRLTQLINNILDFSRIESGQRAYHFEDTDLRDVVRDALKTFDVRLDHEGFQVDLDLPDTLLPKVRIDPGAIVQAVCNLLDNAVKYSNGGRRIGVRLRAEGDYAVLAVQDEGIGISREEQKKIFDRFHRVSTGLVHDVRGSGLGLAIVQHVVQAHGGRVRVESQSGEGSTFSILLPLGEEG